MKVQEERRVFEKKFPERLKLLLERNKMTQAELAEKIGITEASLSRYANGVRIPKGPAIVAMAKALDTSVNYLMCYVEEFE